MNWDLIQAVLLSLVPGLFWLYYIRGLGRYRPEPLWMLALACLAGGVSTCGVMAASDGLARYAPGVMSLPTAPLPQLFYFVVAVGLMEETWKMLAVRLTVYNLPSFDEPVDGLLYAGCAALGFASVENVKYILEAGDPSILVGRSILATFGHVLMSAFWGYALGMQRAPGAARRGAPLVTLALLTAALCHGVYDWLLSQGFPLAAVAAIALMWWRFSDRIEESRRMSPYRQHLVRRVRECPHCGILFRSEALHCTGCGKSSPAQTTLCANCLHEIQQDPAVCPSCACGFAPELR